MKNKKYITIGFIAAVLFFSVELINDYKEKNLGDVVNFNPSDLNYLDIDMEVHTNEKIYAEKLIEFISQYRVQKIRSKVWEREYSATKGFTFIISKKNGDSVSFTIQQERLHYHSSDYYKVLNGPINMDWLENFKNELEQRQKLINSN
ncbi:hypothetical protein [Paraliobacillus sp. JSM ZJ581]|uniref:hypothetical protein n=1 Tax=Paraliobacillus sp. JSM ZJ581 TaxID=3342118 RepID=UPI0035A99146